MPIIMALVGLFLGAVLDRHGGWLYGLMAGLALGLVWSARSRISRLERELKLLRGQMALLYQQEEHSDQEPAEEQETAPSVQPPAASDTATLHSGESILAENPARPEKPRLSPNQEVPVAVTAAAPPINAQQTVASAAAEPTATQQPNNGYASPAEAAVAKLWTFFTTGNIIAKVGVVVLFFGVAFSVKYAAESGFFPIELRLAGIAAGGVAMLAVGWKLRASQRVYALILQGGAVGVLYLTVFAAFRLYQLIPATPAFALLFLFTLLGVLLAVWQNALTLAVLAVSGGFLAPVLTSTGSGSHVALFSYYLVLNLGILAIAWFHSWRVLNLTGFVFTFVIASLWGVHDYRPEYFSTTEPFLIAFFLLYVTVSVLFAFRQPVHLKGLIDGSLVFGLPLVAVALQAALVRDWEYGLAWSMAALAGFYALLAWVLWQRLKPESRLLCEAFGALAVISATLTIPLAVDAQWTSAMWALQGAAMVWVGLRQQRLLARLFGYALQLAAGMAYLADLPHDVGGVLIVNGLYLGALILALSGLLIAACLRLRDAAPLSNRFEFRLLSPVFLSWGLAWWYLAGIHEVLEHLDSQHEVAALLVFFGLSSAAAHYLQGLLNWRQMRYPAHSLLPLLFVLLPWSLFDDGHAMAGWQSLGWVLGVGIHYWILRRYDEWQTYFLSLLHMGGLWLVMLLATLEAVWWVDRWQGSVDIWWHLTLGVVPAVLLAVLHYFGQRWPWPIRTHPQRYLVSGLIPVAAGLGLWFWLMNLGSDGGIFNWPYWPFINPLDMALLMVFCAVAYWLRKPAFNEDWDERRWRYPAALPLLGLSSFLWLNTQWLRWAHHYWDIPWDWERMLDASQVQAGLSVLWGLTGLACMVLGHRRVWRPLWLTGAGIMAAVVLKLFLVDLANSGSLERIVSFLSVGGLLLVVGYFAPVPPRIRATD